MTRNFPTRSLTFAPEALRLVDAYAERRGIKRSKAVSELLLYVFMGDQCPTNPKVIKATLSTIREESDVRGRA
jgi:hypothetical protein